MKNIGVLISGGGTNLQALIDKQGSVIQSGRIVCVCSNSAGAYGLERAKKAGIDTKVIRKNADCGGSVDEMNRQICRYMKEKNVDIQHWLCYKINVICLKIIYYFFSFSYHVSYIFKKTW